MFTGDRSGDFLYPTLHRFGFCSQAESADRKDGLELAETYITAALHCVPPGNKPQSEEMSACRPFLIRELALLHRVRVVVALGGIAWQAYLRARKEMGGEIPQPRPKFGHGVTCELEGRIALIASYHPSQQNTQTGRLTQTMFDEIFVTARKILLTT
jgi:uracil-DNA glycosylase family 4